LKLMKLELGVILRKIRMLRRILVYFFLYTCLDKIVHHFCPGKFSIESKNINLGNMASSLILNWQRIPI
jgi:hypothetical protein